MYIGDASAVKNKMPQTAPFHCDLWPFQPPLSGYKTTAIILNQGNQYSWGEE